MFIRQSIDNGTRRRILVVANETVTRGALRGVVDIGDHEAQLLVVAPALTGRLAFRTSDDTGARRDGEERLRGTLAVLDDEGLDAEGVVGDADPVRAIDDALRLFPADEIVVATHPEPRANWLARRVVSRARLQFKQPIHHVVLDGPPVQAAA